MSTENRNVGDIVIKKEKYEGWTNNSNISEREKIL